MADRIKVMRYGEEVEEAPAREMVTAPREDYTKSLWSVRALRGPEKPPSEILLSVDNVDAGYGAESRVLHDVSIHLPKGRTVAVGLDPAWLHTARP